MFIGVFALALSTTTTLAFEGRPATNACETPGQPSDPASMCLLAAAHRDGSFDESLRRVRVILEGEPRNSAALLVLAALHADLGNPSTESEYRAAVEAARGKPSREIEAESRLGLANLLIKRQRLSEAEGQISAAAAVARGLSWPTGAVLTESAALAYSRHQYNRALELLKEAEPVLFPAGPLRWRGEWLSQKGAAAWALDEIDQSLATYRRQAEMLASAGDRFGEAASRVGMVLLGLSAGVSHDKLRTQTEAALAEARATRNIAIEGRACFYMAQLTKGREALGYAQRSLALARERQDVAGVFMGLRAVASHLAPYDRDAALRLIDEAIALARARGDLAETSRNLTVRSRMAWRGGERGRAIQDSLAALDGVEADRGAQHGSLPRARRFGSWRLGYDSLVGHLLAGDLVHPRPPSPSPEDTALAFQTMERRRARMLLDILAARPGQEGLPLLVSLVDLEAEVASDQALLFFQIQREVAGDGTYLGGSWLLVVAQGQVRAYHLADGDQLTAETRILVGLLAGPGGVEAQACARVYADLLGRALADLPHSVSRLVIVPDTPLESLPFPLLRCGPGSLPLAASLDISLVPSASVWVRLKRARTRGGPGAALVLADPDLSKTVHHAREGFSTEFAPLPWAREEGRAVATTVGEGSELRLGERASEDALKHAPLARFGLIHFASHALLDEDPEQSALLLAAGSEREDGWLRASEIAALPLGGKVIVLSGCETAGGTAISGEGVVGLAHAFFQAGAQAVVATLWPLRDSEAAHFFARFYAKLCVDPHLGAALVKTRNEAIEAGVPDRVWASVALIGDADAEPIPVHLAGPLASRLPIWAITVVGVCLGGALVAARRRLGR